MPASFTMYLGVEIGGTKLQLGVGAGDGSPFLALRRLDVDAAQGAAGIRAQIAAVVPELQREFGFTRVGVGFGGPVDAGTGCVTKSHQVAGWDAFPLAAWFAENWQLETTLANDCDAAALAEARFGAGRGCRSVFFLTVGTGIGGGFVLDGRLHGAGRPAVAEIGHLRPGVGCTSAESTVEAVSAGPALAAAAQRAGFGAGLELLTTKDLAAAARAGNSLARDVFRAGTETLGWAIAQMITLLAPECVVVGGGVALSGEDVFFRPLAEAVARYVFPPLRDSYVLRPAALGEEVVVHGALALAALALAATADRSRH